MLRPILALVACSTLALAQALPDPPPPRPPQAQGWLVDAITATVNDSAIMLSDLRTLTASAIRGAERQFGPLSPQEHKLITQRELAALVNKYRMAQSVKSLGVLTPEQVEQLLRSELDSDKEDQRRDLGSMQALSLELKRQGRSWPTYEREKRVDKLNLFAQEFAVNRRLARQTNLFLTPRMLRQTYDDNRGMFVRDAAAKVVWVQFQGADAAATAEQAADLWRREELSPRQPGRPVQERCRPQRAERQGPGARLRGGAHVRAGRPGRVGVGADPGPRQCRGRPGHRVSLRSQRPVRGPGGAGRTAQAL